MNLSFGVNPDDYQFDPTLADSGGGTSDPNDSFLEKARKAALVRQMFQQQIDPQNQDQSPAPVTIPRVQNQAEDPTFFQKHPGGAKLADGIAATIKLISNLRTMKQNNAAGRYGARTPLIGDLPSFSEDASKKTALQNKNAQDVQEQNSRIAEAESRINSNAMSRYATRKSAELGQMMPAVTRAAFRDPRAPKAPPLYQQKLDTLQKNPAYIAATDDEKNKMQLHVIGADVKQPKDYADAYNAAMARLQSKLDFQKKNPGAAGGKDVQEADIADMAKYMQGLIVNDFTSPEDAADMALKYGRNKMKLREAVGKDPTFTPGAMNPAPNPVAPPPSPAGANMGDRYGSTAPPPTDTSGRLPNGATSTRMFSVRPEQPATGLPAQSLPPDLQSKLSIYSRLGATNPTLRARMRADLMQAYGVDPDTLVEPGH